MGAAVSRFEYGRDGLCLVSMGLYATNQIWIKSHVAAVFFHSHFNDLLLIPAALPWILWIHRYLGWRADDRAPSRGEVLLHVLVWTLVCEGLGPALGHRGTADVWDAVAYFVGGVVAWIWWNRPLERRWRWQ